ncbi:DUF885 domain-containing protein [Colwellia psychrerythraea]|uniref:DUF885 domain-containing protein n=1 Tax=Colwellia psychrerythraea TaxID=28229 RepID=A0A099KCQ4_COLPS|nr:DUF885 domain-containing protein [Colwellia psychrerythraea]KGJ87373.1 protein of unknown function DUF885 [Colwellia psychrerythraea]
MNNKLKNSLLASTIMAALGMSGCDNNNDAVAINESAIESKKASESAGNSAENSAEQHLTKLYLQAKQSLFKQRALSATMFGLSEQDVGLIVADKMEVFASADEARLRAELLSISNEIANIQLVDADITAKNNQQVMAGLTRYFAGDPNFTVGFIDTWMGLSPFIVNQINGPLIDIPRIMQNDQSITSEQEALAYIARLGQFDKLTASIIEKQTFDAAQNWLPPKVTLLGAIKYLNGFISVPAEQHSFVKVFSDKIEKVDSLSAEQKQGLIKQVITKVSEVVYPAFKSVTKASEQLLTQSRDESGIWAQPKGSIYYQDAIKQLGDSELTPSQIHQIGLDEVIRISSAMDKTLQAQGYKIGSVGERMVALNEEPRFLYEDSKAGRAELLSDINGYISEITTKMAPVFKTTPSYQVEVKAFPVEVQDGAPGGQYTSPAVDGSKPGIYWINLRDMKANPKFGLKTLTYHEANPGHHWQIALNLDQAELPFLRRIAPYNAYAEGWALYSEQVAFELGMYENDPFGDLGRLQAELFRAVRLVVDTGLHDKRWTREQAISYMAEKTGTAESDVIAEIERYMAWPGQALGYKLGMLKILSLREQAKRRLGDKFDLAEFHDVVLLNGAVPMAVLSRNINHWLDSKS